MVDWIRAATEAEANGIAPPPLFVFRAVTDALGIQDSSQRKEPRGTVIRPPAPRGAQANRQEWRLRPNPSMSPTYSSDETGAKMEEGAGITLSRGGGSALVAAGQASPSGPLTDTRRVRGWFSCGRKVAEDKMGTGWSRLESLGPGRPIAAFG
jgi:hypothetical protein